MDRILIISNRVLSETDSNGKTLLSFLSGIEKERVSQLYFYGNSPMISGYNYFQLSDMDIIRGIINSKKRGRRIEAVPKNTNFYNIDRYHIKRSSITLYIREMVWKYFWKSDQLDEWLGKVNPSIVFFMAGNSKFAYDICSYVVSNFNTKLYTYVTDDYFLPRADESFFEKKVRESLVNKMKRCIDITDKFFTISNRMRQEYIKLFNKDSSIIYNMPNSLYDETLRTRKEDLDKIVFVYTGSLYYGRKDILLDLALEIDKYNSEITDNKKAVLYIYSNSVPDEDYINVIEKINCVFFKGNADKEQMKAILNSSDILVYVESFENKYIEKVRLSFSTKIPEYLSVSKPILSIAPTGIGSIDLLQACAITCDNIASLGPIIRNLLNDENLREQLSIKAKEKFTKELEKRKSGVFPADNYRIRNDV